MEALHLLLNRTSQGRLQAPAPGGEELENICQAALRAPDHAGLNPWRFIICTDAGLTKLGQIYKQAAIDAGMSPADIERAEKLPERAPMVIIAITEYKAHAKVPRVEQICSTACAVQSMQMAAYAQSYSGIWRTGSYATNCYVKQELGLKEEDEIVGFLYLGTPIIATPKRPAKDTGKYFEIWE